MEEKKKRGRPPKEAQVKELARVKARKEVGWTDTYPQVKKSQLPAPGENAAIAAWTMELLAISQRADKNDPETLRQCFIDYLQLCIEKDHKISNLGAYMSIGISRQTASNWKLGKKHMKNSAYRELIEYIDLICAQAREELIMDNKLNPVIGIFWQKNFDGYTDQRIGEAVVNPLEVQSSAPDIAEKYQDIPD